MIIIILWKPRRAIFYSFRDVNPRRNAAWFRCGAPVSPRRNDDLPRLQQALPAGAITERM